MALNSGLYKMLGQMIAHSICQGCSGFCVVLAPAMYYYIATGDINQVMTVTDKEMVELNMDDGFMKLIQDSGLTVFLTDENRAMVQQSLLSHLVIGKRVALLDQFARGLKTLGLLEEICAKPEVFEPLFVSSPKLKITSEEVKSQFRMKGSGENSHTGVFTKLCQYIDESTEDELKDLLKFTTGGEMLPSSAVSVDVCGDNESIYALTCLCELVFPKVMADWDYSDFKAAVAATIKGNAFNCV